MEEGSRVDDDREALTAALRSIVGMPCDLLLATNSIRLRFDFRSSPRGRTYFWIDPPWRLMVGGSLRTWSNDYPTEDDAKDKKVLQSLEEAWFAHFDGLDGASLAEASVGPDDPDLCLRFESGHRIETFSHGGPKCWWYYRDCVSGEVFEAGPWGIRRELRPPAEAEPGPPPESSG
jgi:hypothetical protein